MILLYDMPKGASLFYPPLRVVVASNKPEQEQQQDRADESPFDGGSRLQASQSVIVSEVWSLRTFE